MGPGRSRKDQEGLRKSRKIQSRTRKVQGSRGRSGPEWSREAPKVLGRLRATELLSKGKHDVRLQESKEAKTSKEAKETKKAKEVKETKEAEEAKHTKEAKEAEGANGVKLGKEAKEAKDAKEARDPILKKVKECYAELVLLLVNVCLVEGCRGVGLKGGEKG